MRTHNTDPPPPTSRCGKALRRDDHGDFGRSEIMMTSSSGRPGERAITFGPAGAEIRETVQLIKITSKPLVPQGAGGRYAYDRPGANYRGLKPDQTCDEVPTEGDQGQAWHGSVLYPLVGARIGVKDNHVLKCLPEKPYGSASGHGVPVQYLHVAVHGVRKYSSEKKKKKRTPSG